MKILLIRHGESTGNRDHIWAGITDSELTNHGFLQASRLAGYLAKSYKQQIEDGCILGVFCSDLTRARRTAQEIATALQAEITVTKLLREQDLGWREGRSIKDGDRKSPTNAEAMSKQPGESKADMDERSRVFISEYLDLHLQQAPPASQSGEPLLIIVSHGLFLLRLYYVLATHLKVSSPPPVSWSNTGCTIFRILPDGVTTVTDVNSVQHLQGLKRTRAGVGSSQYDSKQQKVSAFFRSARAKINEDNDEEIIQEAEMLEVSESDAVGSCSEEAQLAEQIRAIDEACATVQYSMPPA